MAGSKILVVAAHQDDEAFIVSRMKSHIDKGDFVHILWTTRSTKLSEGYAALRQSEAIRAANLLGICPGKLTFFDYEDGHSHCGLADLISDLSDFLEALKPSTVYVPAFEGGHIDHDIAHFASVLVLFSLNLKCMVYEYPLYSGYGVKKGFPFSIRGYNPNMVTSRRELGSTERDLVEAYWTCYASQTKRFLSVVERMDQLDVLFGEEHYRVLPKHAYLVPPWGQKPAYERFLRGVGFVDFQRAIVGMKESECLKNLPDLMSQP